MTQYDVFGLGHTLIDFTWFASETERLNLQIDKDDQRYVSASDLQALLNQHPESLALSHVGGNVRNTLQVLAELQIQTLYASTIGNDSMGQRVQQDLKLWGIADRLALNLQSTGFCLVIVTPDGEKSFITYDGDTIPIAPMHLSADDLTHSKIFYSTGYMLNNPSRHQVLDTALELAKTHDVPVAFDLADHHIVMQHQTQILTALQKQNIQILLGNKAEFAALLGDDFLDQPELLQKLAPIVVVKLGREGAMIFTATEIHTIAPPQVLVKDSTGAGDVFAAGFLYGLLQHYSIANCGKLAAFVAGKKLQCIGIQFPKNILQLVTEFVNALAIASPRPSEDQRQWRTHFKQEFEAI